jgi:hypothetical protein
VVAWIKLLNVVLTSAHMNKVDKVAEDNS